MTKPKQDDSFWYSKLDVAAQCLYRYKREFIDKVPVHQSTTDAIEFGSAIHASIEALFDGEDPLIQFKVEWNARKAAPGLQFMRYSWKELSTIGNTLLAKFERLHFKHIEPILFEKRIYGDMGSHKYEGTPDIYGKYKGKLAVIDFKTSSQRYDKDKIKIAKQLVDYVSLVEQNGFQKPEILVYFVFIKANSSIQVLELPINRFFLQTVETSNTLLIEDLKTRTTFPKNFRSCLNYNTRCPHWDHCIERKE